MCWKIMKVLSLNRLNLWPGPRPGPEAAAGLGGATYKEVQARPGDVRESCSAFYVYCGNCYLSWGIAVANNLMRSFPSRALAVNVLFRCSLSQTVS